MEFKLDGTAEEALLQINEKYYAQPFEMMIVSSLRLE